MATLPLTDESSGDIMTIRVLVADDQALVRAGFVALLDAQDGIEVVAEADTGTRALASARELRPDVVLMDIRMPEMDGLAATRADRRRPGARRRPGGGADDVRARRVRVRGDAGRRERVPGQTHRADGAGAGGAGGRRRRCAAVAVGDAQAGVGVRRADQGNRRARRPRWPS